MFVLLLERRAMGTRLLIRFCARILVPCLSSLFLIIAGVPIAKTLHSLKSVGPGNYNREVLFLTQGRIVGSFKFLSCRGSLSMSAYFDPNNSPDSPRKSKNSSLTFSSFKQKRSSNESSVVISMLNKALKVGVSLESLDIFRQEMDSMRGRDIAEAMHLSSKVHITIICCPNITLSYSSSPSSWQAVSTALHSELIIIVLIFA